MGLQKGKMNYKLIVGIWLLFSASIIYWDINRHEDAIPLSDCHNVEIKMIHDRPMCTECKMYCEVKNEN